MVPLLALQLVLSLVLGYLLAVFAAAMRDTLQIVTFLLSVGIFVSPVLFPTSMFPQAWRWVLWINPMSAPVTGYQAVLLQGQWPGWTTWVTLGCGSAAGDAGRRGAAQPRRAGGLAVSSLAEHRRRAAGASGWGRNIVFTIRPASD